MTQWQATATKLLDPIPSLAINSIALVGEVGFDYVHNFGHLAGLYNAPYTTDTNSAYEVAATVDTAQVPGQPGSGYSPARASQPSSPAPTPLSR